jgi:hypothetical protein
MGSAAYRASTRTRGRSPRRRCQSSNNWRSLGPHPVRRGPRCTGRHPASKGSGNSTPNLRPASNPHSGAACTPSCRRASSRRSHRGRRTVPSRTGRRAGTRPPCRRLPYMARPCSRCWGARSPPRTVERSYRTRVQRSPRPARQANRQANRRTNRQANRRSSPRQTTRASRASPRARPIESRKSVSASSHHRRRDVAAKLGPHWAATYFDRTRLLPRRRELS